MLSRVPRRAGDIGCCAAAVVAMLVAQNVFSLRSSTPVGLLNDHTFLLSAARQMMDGQGFWHTDRAGFPLGQSAVYFPEFEPLLKLVLFAVAQLPIGVFGIVKVFTVLGAVGIVVSAYWCFRRLGCGAVLAGVGAVVFAVSPYYAARMVAHDYLSIYVCAPFGVALAMLIARVRSLDELVRLGRSAFTWVALLIIATCGLYYAFFSLVLGVAVLLGVAIRLRSVWPVATLAVWSAATLAVLTVGALGPYLGHGLAGTPERLPVEQLFHGLSVADAIYAFDWVPGMRRIVAAYDAVRPLRMIGEGRGEWPGALVTLAILGSPLLLLAGSPARLPSSLPGRDRFAAAGLIALLIIVTSRGGIGFLFNEIVTPAIRGQTRVMPFLMFPGLFLCLSYAEEYWDGRIWWRRAATVAIAACLLAGTIPSINQFGRREAQMKADPRVAQGIVSFRGVADAVRAAGLRAVLELPVVPWPEVPPRDGYDYYTMRLPEVFDPRGSPTRWSYGASRLEPGFGEFLATIRSDVDPDGVAFRAHRLGFDGALLEKRALPAGEAQHLLAALLTPGHPDCLLYEDADRALVDIGRKPYCAHAVPQGPAGPLEISLQGKASEFTDLSFALPDAQGTWSSTMDSTLLLPAPVGDGDVAIRLVFTMLPSRTPTRQLTAWVGSRIVGEFEVPTAPNLVTTVEIRVPAELAPAGELIPLHLHFDGPESEPTVSIYDRRKLTAHLQTIRISRR